MLQCLAFNKKKRFPILMETAHSNNIQVLVITKVITKTYHDHGSCHIV